MSNSQTTDRPLRAYEPIWQRLKRSRTQSIEVLINNPRLVNRIKRGVIKEKYKDDGFKIINERDYLWLEIRYDVDNKKMKFTLRQRHGIEEVKS